MDCMQICIQATSILSFISGYDLKSELYDGRWTAKLRETTEIADKHISLRNISGWYVSIPVSST